MEGSFTPGRKVVPSPIWIRSYLFCVRWSIEEEEDYGIISRELDRARGIATMLLFTLVSKILRRNYKERVASAYYIFLYNINSLYGYSNAYLGTGYSV